MISRIRRNNRKQDSSRLADPANNAADEEWEDKRFKLGGGAPPKAPLKKPAVGKPLAKIKRQNRRRFYRASPGEGTVVNVTMKLPANEVAGQMLDISAGGMGVLVTKAAANELKVPEWLRLKVDLPETLLPLDLVGSVPYRRQAADCYHYGVQFNWEKTPYYYRQEAAISAFVQQCQLNKIRGIEKKPIPIDDAHRSYYRDTPLFIRAGDKFKLYKAAGKIVDETRLSGAAIPVLYVHPDDQEIAICEVLGGLNGKLPRAVASEKVSEVKAVLEEVLQLAVSDTQYGSLDMLADTVDILINSYRSRSEALTEMATASFSLYTPILHTLNITALTLRFCFFQKLSRKDALRMGLAALVHDLGKIEMPRELLFPKQKLSLEQFNTYRVHPYDGYTTINLSSKLGKTVAIAALQHHEKMDGSGYPGGIRDISPAARLLGIIDAYENLTNFHRTYRHAKTPIEALRQLKKETDTGKYDRELFTRFCYSLT